MAVAAIAPSLVGSQLPIASPIAPFLPLAPKEPPFPASASFITSISSTAGPTASPYIYTSQDDVVSPSPFDDTLFADIHDTIDCRDVQWQSEEQDSCRGGVLGSVRSALSAAYLALSSWTIDRPRANRFGKLGNADMAGLVDQVHRWQDDTRIADFWTSGEAAPETWSEEEQELRKIPQYVYDYAPYVHLFSGEEFWPCDMAEHLLHTTPFLNYTPIEEMKDDRTLDNLHELNSFGRYTYLQSNDNVEERPNWLGGARNIPESSESDGTPRGRSSAPAVLVVIPKGNGIVDAFWFYFYSYNLGNKVFNVRFGNHIGDWEHSLVRFKDGKPTEVFVSEHSFGEAYGYDAVEKIGKRPLIYSAVGSHAMYATPGLHPYILPWGLLHDQTDKGPLWDPLQNFHGYTFNLSTRELLASTDNPKSPTNWFFFGGHWGDRAYPLTDRRQYTFAGQYHYVSGPIGPIFKNLGRKKICQGHGECKIKHWLGGEIARIWPGGDTMDEMVNVGVYD